MATALEMPENAAALLVDRHIAETNGDRVALRYGEKRYSYHDLAALMNRAGNMFRKLGVAPGQPVVIAVAPSPAWAAALLGAMKIGAVAVLVPRSPGEAAFATAVKKLKPVAVVVDADRLDNVGKIAEGVATITVGESGDPEHSFVQLLRESASSLVRARMGEAAPAIAVVEGAVIRTATHEQLASEGGGAPLGLGVIDGIDVEAALSAFARCSEVAIAAAR